jgi:hypothetical protein
LSTAAFVAWLLWTGGVLAANVLSNGSFEGSGSGSLAGWARSNATLALATDGVNGTFAARVTPRAGSSTAGLNASPKPVGSTTAGTAYTAAGMYHAASTSVQICLRLREFRPGGAAVKSASGCMKPSGSGWEPFPAVTLVAANSGDTIGLNVYQTNSRPDRPFEVDALVLDVPAPDSGSPTIPVNVSGTATDSQVSLRWDASTDDRGVTGYRVLRDGMLAGTSATTSFTDFGLLSSTPYSYTVQAYDAAGKTSDPSLAFTILTAAQPAAVCGTQTSATYSHVVVIVMENMHFSRVIGSSHAPYINNIASWCGLATDFHAINHPSLPNYIHMTAGTSSITTNCLPGPSCRDEHDNIFNQTTWLAPAEGMTKNCQKTGDPITKYAPRHNPAVYFTMLSNCAANSVPLGQSVPLDAAFTFVVPNLCSDMHDPCTTAKSPTYTFTGDPAGCTLSTLTSDQRSDCEVEQGDLWLSGFLPKITGSGAYQSGSTAVFVTWDEDGAPRQDNRVPFVVLSPTTPAGATSSRPYNHYSALRTWQDILGLPCLANSCTASSMRGDLGL